MCSMSPVLYLRLDHRNEPFAGYSEPVVEPDCLNLALPNDDVMELKSVLGDVERQCKHFGTEVDVTRGAFFYLEKDREFS